MSNQMTRRAACAALAVLLAVMTAASPAPAAELRCKSDPTVLLSDGTVLDLSADIGAPLWEVTSIQYSIRVPMGLAVVAVIRTPNWPTTIERFHIRTDGQRGRYDSATVVRTAKGTDVTAQFIVAPLLGLPRLGSDSGWSGELLRVIITP